MVAIVTLLATLTFSTLVTRVAAVALMLTGLSGRVASHNEAVWLKLVELPGDHHEANPTLALRMPGGRNL